MAWARVDDGWWCHPKVIGLPLAERGLWISTLSWSCQHQTDQVPAAIVRMVGGDDATAAGLVDAGLWEGPDARGGYTIHDWDDFQSERAKKAEAGRKGGRRSGESRRAKAADEADDGASREADRRASPEAGPTRPDPTRPEANPSSPDGDAAAETGADDAAGHDAPDPTAEADGRFEDHFWPVYPPMPNGKKPEKGKALQQWRRLTLEQQRRAVIGARNLARADTIPKHAHRFLRRDTAGEFPFDDWQAATGTNDARRAADNACHMCGQRIEQHDEESCLAVQQARRIA